MANPSEAMANERCAGCGALIAMVGRRHRCVPPGIEIAAGPSPLPASTVTKALDPSASAPQASYRYRDPEKRREYMRNYMRGVRAKEAKS